MSHIPQRKEKDCLNCGTIVAGKYCQECGQENVVPHEGFWHMVKHFAYDITHFDSKFFDSMKYLLFRPGFLPKEYIKGKRASYLNPVKKYVFTSAIFFLLFFTFFVGKDPVVFDGKRQVDTERRKEGIAQTETLLKKKPGDEKLTALLVRLRDTADQLTENDLIALRGSLNIVVGSRQYDSLVQYDSVQRSLPADKRDSWFEQRLQRTSLKWKAKYGDRADSGMGIVWSAFLHKLPYLLFVSLPLFALILKLLYIRRKEYYYVDHGIFAIYHYIFTFILLLFVFLLGELEEKTGLSVFSGLAALTFLSGGIYLFISMKRFYGQKTGKTILKFLLLNAGAFLMLLLLFVAFLLVSFFQV